VGVTSYTTNRARAAAQAADSAVYSRRRFVTGLLLGFVIQLVLAAVLGFLLVDQMGPLNVRLGATTISCLIATPVTTALGFAIGLSGKLRRLGMGIVVGALLSTLVIVVPFAIMSF
jgi:hypothetical protein